MTLEDLTSADLTLEDSETFAVTPVSISRDDPARPVTKVTFICRPLPISLIMPAIREAINVLNGIDNKTAQWYYYSAIANSGHRQ